MRLLTHVHQLLWNQCGYLQWIHMREAKLMWCWSRLLENGHGEENVCFCVLNTLPQQYEGRRMKDLIFPKYQNIYRIGNIFASFTLRKPFFPHLVSLPVKHNYVKRIFISHDTLTFLMKSWRTFSNAFLMKNVTSFKEASRHLC